MITIRSGIARFAAAATTAGRESSRRTPVVPREAQPAAGLERVVPDQPDPHVGVRHEPVVHDQSVANPHPEGDDRKAPEPLPDAEPAFGGHERGHVVGDHRLDPGGFSDQVAERDVAPAEERCHQDGRPVRGVASQAYPEPDRTGTGVAQRLRAGGP